MKVPLFWEEKKVMVFQKNQKECSLDAKPACLTPKNAFKGFGAFCNKHPFTSYTDLLCRMEDYFMLFVPLVPLISFMIVEPLQQLKKKNLIVALIFRYQLEGTPHLDF